MDAAAVESITDAPALPDEKNVDDLTVAFDCHPVATMVLDEDHCVTYWNEACEQLTGVARRDVLGRRLAWRALYVEERPTPADELIDVGADKPGVIEREHFQVRAENGGRWLTVRARRLVDAHARGCGAVQTLEDMTAVRRASEELARLRNQTEKVIAVRSAELSARVRELEAFVKNAPIGVAFCSEGVIKYANHALAQMLGATEAELIHRSDTIFRQPPPDGEIAATTESESGAWMRHSSGRPLWVQLDTHGSSVGTWWMAQDRSDYRAARQQLMARLRELRETNEHLAEAQNRLLQQEKMASIGQLAAGIAHEINNPVGFVSSNLNMLREHVVGLMRLVDAQDQALAQVDAALSDVPRQVGREIDIGYLREDLPVLLDECAEGLDRVRKIVQDLKDFSRVDNQDWQAADLLAGLESTLNVLRNEVRYKAEVARKLEPLPLVQCLPAQINQVFMNLIVNAAQAIETHGTITLSSGHQGGWVWLQIADTGHGMTDEVKRRIFEPFFTTKDVGKGTGLGLSLSFSIVAKHGGRIDVRSAPGCGSEFRIWLPVDGPQPGQLQEPPEWK